MCINVKMMQFPTPQLSFLSFPLCQKTTSETGAEDATVCLSCSLQCTRGRLGCSIAACDENHLCAYLMTKSMAVMSMLIFEGCKGKHRTMVVGTIL